MNRKQGTGQSSGEEIANSITHGVGLVLSIAGLAVLAALAALHGDVWRLVSFSIYGSMLILLYLASVFYHSVRSPRAKRVFRIFDHSAIYLLIAGTYTPFTLVSLRGAWGWALFGSIWGFAVSGIVFKIFFIHRFGVVSTVIYLLMGWLVVVAVKPVIAAIPSGGVLWLVAGGLAYTLGVAFFALDRFPYFHAAWHLFVLAGSICHYFAILLYVLPVR